MINANSMNSNLAAAVLLPAAYAVFLLIPATNALAELWLLENQPVELLTFFLLLGAGVLGLVIAARGRKRNEPLWQWGFYAVYGAGAIVVAAEEVAWGQWFVPFETPEVFYKYNRQRMVTLHNLPGIDARSEIIRVFFGLGGAIGVALRTREGWERIAPQRALLPWFVVIFALATVDFINDLTPLQETFDYVINKLSEFVELMIAIAAGLYLWLNRKVFST